LRQVKGLFVPDCFRVSSYQQPEGAQDKGPSSSWQREGRNTCVRLRYTSIAHGSSESMCDKASIGIPGAVDKFRRFALTTSSKEYRGLKSAIAEMMDFP